MKVSMLATLLALSATATQAGAAAYGMGKITQIGGQGSGANIVYFGLTPAPVGRAGCNTHSTYQFIIDISTADGTIRRRNRHR
jgi:hypothetical protein